MIDFSPKSLAAVALLAVAGLSCRAPTDRPQTAGAGPRETAPAPSVAGLAPTNAKELHDRVEQLRAHYAPYLRSLPEALDVRERNLLAGPWRARFELEKAAGSQRPAPPAWFAEDLDDSGWEQVIVPEWRYGAEGPKQPVSSILWYRHRFAAKPPKAGQRVFLVFGGVEWEAQVWLNGRSLGTHKGYCEPFRFDVTSSLKNENVLAVRVFSGPKFGEPIAYWAVLPDTPAREQRFVRDPAKSIPDYQRQSPHLGSGLGIHREVFLETTREAAIGDIFARSDPADSKAEVTVETDSTASTQLELEVSILPENFRGQSYRQTLSRPVPQGSGRQTLSIPMPGAQRWSPQTPRLYRCRAILRDPRGIVDARDVLFGCRSFGLVSRQNPRPGLPEGMFLLNGEPVFLRGANVSPAFNLFWYWRQPEKLTEAVLLLKAANYNAIRVCQHVSFPEVRELLDRFGVMSEQDQGGGRNGNTPEALAALADTGTALARVCYNNPGVVLLSFGNETRFDPTLIVQAVLAVDPQRIIAPISGNDYRGGPAGYPIPEALWSNVIDDFHAYPGWYDDPARIWKLSQLRDPARLVTMGEYGAEGLDSYETMAQHYPPSFGKTPLPSEDVLWGQVQVRKDDARQLIGFRGERPRNLAQYIAASQTYQADVLAEVSKGLRLSPRGIAGYFQFHFVDATAALWPKAVVSFDLRPKPAYYEMAQVNQPVVPLFQFRNRAKSMELYVANDLPAPLSNCALSWSVQTGGRTVLEGCKQAVAVPACDATPVENVDLASIPEDTNAAVISLTLADAGGRVISQYRRALFLKAWRLEDAVLPPAAARQ